MLYQSWNVSLCYILNINYNPRQSVVQSKGLLGALFWYSRIIFSIHHGTAGKWMCILWIYILSSKRNKLLDSTHIENVSPPPQISTRNICLCLAYARYKIQTNITVYQLCRSVVFKINNYFWEWAKSALEISNSKDTFQHCFALLQIDSRYRNINTWITSPCSYNNKNRRHWLVSIFSWKQEKG